MATNANELRREASLLFLEYQKLTRDQLAAIGRGDSAGASQIRQEAKRLLDQANVLLDQAEATTRSESPPVSSGSVVNNNQTARVEGAVTQNPGGNATVTLGPATVQQAIPVDEGLDPDPIKLDISQATPAPNINSARVNVAALVEGGLSPQEALTIAAGGTATTATQPGVGDGRADSPIITGNSTKDIINATFATSTNQRIVTQPNILDEYTSYTYQIGWYLLNNNQYNDLIKTSRKNTANWALLIQSGGIPQSATTGTTGTAFTPGRDPAFPVDFYLDDLEITTKIPFGGTQMSHTATEIKFRVTEPNGITLIDRLFQAVKKVYSPQSVITGNDPTIPDYSSVDPGKSSTAANSNYVLAKYCLVIRFYGYDSAGNLVAPIRGRRQTSSGNSTTALSDPSAAVEKFYPFNIANINFRIGNRSDKGVEYSVECKPIGQFAGFGQARGTIPFNFELSGTVVKDLLVGKPPAAGLSGAIDGRVETAQPVNIATAPSAANDQFINNIAQQTNSIGVNAGAS